MYTLVNDNIRQRYFKSLCLFVRLGARRPGGAVHVDGLGIFQLVDGHHRPLFQWKLERRLCPH